MNKCISIVIPVYNEGKNVEEIVRSVQDVTSSLPYECTITFIDDGSDDSTLEIIKEQCLLNMNISFISLSRNFGHQNAIKAALDYCTADCVITMDGDMQHPPELIPQLIEKWEAGNDIVYTVRKDSKKLSGFKRKTSSIFYKLLNYLSGIEIEEGTADFRLLDKKIVNVLCSLEEDNLFWRGLVKWIGFRQASIEYSPALRKFGKSKYTFKKMVSFGLNGITSFSTKPLTIAIYLGFICALLSLLYIPYVLWSIYTGRAISGWASLIVTIVFFGGLQLMILGILGIYLGKLFMQSKKRPHYIIKESAVARRVLKHR
ncbi:MAG: glycosyltransferase family 2 protein [Bacteroidota bacterium]|nr:glycosyltransferase family 2 protein [Bacteroidota bacterium]MDQ6903746.1 glycosyltransferase family 2 protein [Bacteroidota bacterium]